MPVILRSYVRDEKVKLIDVKEKAYRYFEYEVIHEGKVTLQEYLLFIINNYEVLSDTFEVSIENYLREFKKPTFVKKNKFTNSIEFLYINKTIAFKEKTGLTDVQYSFSGWGVSEDEYNKGTKCSLGLDFTPISHIRNCEVLFAPVRVIDYKDNIEYCSPSQTIYTLYEVMHSICNELFFFSSPEYKDNMKADLEKQIEEIENGTVEYEEVTLERMKEMFGRSGKIDLYQVWSRKFTDKKWKGEGWKEYLDDKKVDLSKLGPLEIKEIDPFGMPIKAECKKKKETKNAQTKRKKAKSRPVKRTRKTRK